MSVNRFFTGVLALSLLATLACKSNAVPEIVERSDAPDPFVDWELAKPDRSMVQEDGTLKIESVNGDQQFFWVHPSMKKKKFNLKQRFKATVWFNKQFLGTGTSYNKRAKEFSGWRRTELRKKIIKTLKKLSQSSNLEAVPALKDLEDAGAISDVHPYWIVNGFSCVVKNISSAKKLLTVPGVCKVFVYGKQSKHMWTSPAAIKVANNNNSKAPPWKPDALRHPWYVDYLMARRVWQDYGIAGQGVTTAIHDFKFTFNPSITNNLYVNRGEIPGNGKDDDGNGLIDDVHGYNFMAGKPTGPTSKNVNEKPGHGAQCAAIVCGRGNSKTNKDEFGLAPESKWTGLIGDIEYTVQWAAENGVDTYSMSFSAPGLLEYRSHWRKVLEHGSFAGIFFASGAGNFGQEGSRSFAPVPVQMRTPEDIPEVVFASAGVQRSFKKTPFSSKSPVVWKTEHYKDGKIQKPEVCGFNMGVPGPSASGDYKNGGLNGNSFAGPMFCGAISLMVCADPDVLPWDLKKIMTTTALDVGPKGTDYQTGHGLINCYRSVREVLRRKAVREGRDPSLYVGRIKGDEFDLAAHLRAFKKIENAPHRWVIGSVSANSQAKKLGLKKGDLIVSYNGKPIKNVKALKPVKKAAERAGLEAIVMVVKRGEEQLEFTLKPGPIGITPAPKDLGMPVMK